MTVTAGFILCVATHNKRDYLDTKYLHLYSLRNAAMQHKAEVVLMPPVKNETSRSHAKESSVFSLLSGWAQQGAQTLFATQRILIDLAMRQNASVMHAVRQQLSDPHHSPTAILSEVAGEGISNFYEGQKVLLELGKEQNELLIDGVEDRLGNWPAAHAMAELLRRSVDAILELQEEYLKTASKQTHTWLDAAKAGKPYQPEHLSQLIRENMDSFVKAQKKLLDIVAEEANKATGGRQTHAGARKVKQAEFQQIARQASESLMDAQRKLMDIAGKQMNANLKTAGKTMELLRPFPFLPLTEITREAVKSYVDAQKALMDVMVKAAPAAKVVSKPNRHLRRGVKKEKVAVAVA
jgi:hypothetical protein